MVVSNFLVLMQNSKPFKMDLKEKQKKVSMYEEKKFVCKIYEMIVGNDKLAGLGKEI